MGEGVALAGIHYTGGRCTMMASLEGAMRAIGIDAEPHRIYGLTGQAFVMSVSRDVSELGAMGFHWPHVLGLGQSLGYRVEIVSCDSQDANRAAWQLVKETLDRGHPLIGFGLCADAFYIVYGYEPSSEGIYFLGYGSDQVTQPAPMADLAQATPSGLFIAAIEPSEPRDEREAILSALEFAVSFFDSGGVGPERFGSPRWGRVGYEAWVEALASDPSAVTLTAAGISHNAALWSECKTMAGEFLEWAADYFEDPAAALLLQASEDYHVAAAQLDYLESLLPEDAGDMANDLSLRRESAHLVRGAFDAEADGIERLKQILATR